MKPAPAPKCRRRPCSPFPLPELIMPRLDQALVERGLCESREKAKRAILAGLVKINRHSAHKPSDAVRPDDRIELEAGDKYVGRGGHKLEHALIHFQLKVEGSVAVDLGASTGGFAGCLLQHGESGRGAGRGRGEISVVGGSFIKKKSRS